MYSLKNWVYVASIAGVMAFAVFVLLRMGGLGSPLGVF
jgi:hypothetical protein